MPTKVIRPSTPQPPPPAPEPITPANIPAALQPHWAHVLSAADEFSVPAERIGGTILIESNGNPRAVQHNSSNGNSIGLMQIVPFGVGWQGWHERVVALAGLPKAATPQAIIDALYDPKTNIRVGASILRDLKAQYGSWDKASSAFFLGNPDWRGADTVNGNTGAWYRSTLNEWMAKLSGATPAPQPEPAPPVDQGDVLDLLFGGKPYTISATYGQLVTWSCPGCYDYFPYYGLDSKHHWAYDAAALAGDGAPLYAPFDGTVVCAGTDIGSGAWGTGCAAFPRLNNYGGKPAGSGSGRLELLHEDGDRSLILGHVLSSRMGPGQRVKAGDLIGWQGGMNASHVHVECRFDSGRKIGDPRTLFGGGPLPVVYAERKPFVLSDDIPYWWVEVTADSVPCLQYANPDAAPVRAPLPKGERFQAVARVKGTDGQPWWLTHYADGLGTRVPVKGTKEV